MLPLILLTENLLLFALSCSLVHKTGEGAVVGLGPRPRADMERILWMGGVQQLACRL